MSDKLIVANTPHAIQYFRLASMKGRVSLESKGMKFRINTTPIMRREFGLRARAPHAEVIAAIEAKMAEMLKEVKTSAEGMVEHIASL